MPHSLLPMTREELDQTLALYPRQDMSESFRNRDLSKVFPTVDEFAAVWRSIPCSALQKHLPSISSYHASFLAAIDAGQLARIARNSGGWARLFSALGDEKERCLRLMVDRGFKFELCSQQVLGELLTMFSSPTTWWAIGRLFTNIQSIITEEKGLTGFLTDHFHGHADWLFQHLRYTPHFNILKDDAELVFRRLPGHVNLASQFYDSLKYFLTDPKINKTLSDEQLSSLLIQLSMRDLASLLREPDKNNLANRPDVIKAIALRHGRDTLINSTLLEHYLEKIEPAFWTAQWQLLLPAMSSPASARQLLRRLGDSPETLIVLDQYRAFVEEITPLLDKLGVTKKWLDVLNDPWQGVSGINNTLHSIEAKKNNPCGVILGVVALPMLVLMIVLMITMLVLAMAGIILNLSIKHTETGKTYQKLLDMFKELPGASPSTLVQTYQTLTPYHQALKLEYRGAMFSPASSSGAGQLPTDSSDCGLAYAVVKS